MLQTKAIYNLLRLNAADDPSVEAEKWALEDLRAVGLEALFSRLKNEGVQIDANGFKEFATQCDTPEDLCDLLFSDNGDEEKRDPFYLVVFELWRRLVPEKQSLSIFCDELDYRIGQYDRGLLENDELIQEAFANLLEVLEENDDADPKEVFEAIASYSAHDQMHFLYDYISDLLDAGDSLYASELIEGFAPYANEPFWFDFFRVRLLALTDMGDASTAIHRLFENELELELVLEMLRFLVVTMDKELFTIGLKKAVPLLTDQDEVLDLLAIMADYYSSIHESDMEQTVQKLMDRRWEGPPHPADLQVLKQLVTR